MLSIVVTGHGNFATGMKSMLELVIGENENIFFVDFTTDLSSQDLMKIFQDIYTTVNGNLIFLCDIAGGTPFNQAAILMYEHHRNYAVLGGVNIPCILEAIDQRDNILETQELLQLIKDAGCNNIKIYGETTNDIPTYDNTEGI
ncbi:MAG: hypothetical protein ACRC0X_00285 [Brevinema sp.]